MNQHVNPSQQRNFLDLEWHYLYDIPEPKENKEKLFCEECHRYHPATSMFVVDGDVICKECAQRLVENKYIDEEDIEVWQN